MNVPRIPDGVVQIICKGGAVLAGIGSLATVFLGKRNQEIEMNKAIDKKVDEKLKEYRSED